MAANQASIIESIINFFAVAGSLLFASVALIAAAKEIKKTILFIRFVKLFVIKVNLL